MKKFSACGQYNVYSNNNTEQVDGAKMKRILLDALSKKKKKTTKRIIVY